MSDTVTPTERDRITEIWEPPDRWSVPIFRFGRFQVTLSYLVFAVAAVATGVALNSALSGVGQEALLAAAIAIGFWSSGWLVQTVLYTLISRLIGSPIDQLSIGLFGIKAVPHKWSPAGALAVSLGTITALVALGSIYRLAQGSFPIPNAVIEPESFWTAPSIGVTTSDSPWLAGAWICWIQALFQMYPLTQTLGRQLLASLIALLGPEKGLDFRTQVLGTCLRTVAVATVALAIWISIDLSFPNWPVVLGLGIALWMTSKTSEITQTFLGFQRYAEENQQAGLRESARQIVRTRQGRRRNKLALRQERGEAADAARLDEVLSQLHQNGLDSLSNEDRRLLQRVSERVRKERDADSSAR